MLKNSANYDGVEVKDNDTPHSLEIFEMDLVKVCLISKPQNFAGVVCPICLDQLKDNTVLGPCKHEFCQHCIITWLRHTLDHTCPMCRQQANEFVTYAPIEDPQSLPFGFRLVEGSHLPTGLVYRPSTWSW